MLDGTKGDTIFRSITAGSVAADSVEAHECVGMILEKVDGRSVTTKEDMQRAMAKNTIVLHFRQRPKSARAQEPQQWLRGLL